MWCKKGAYVLLGFMCSFGVRALLLSKVKSLPSDHTIKRLEHLMTDAPCNVMNSLHSSQSTAMQ